MDPTGFLRQPPHARRSSGTGFQQARGCTREDVQEDEGSGVSQSPFFTCQSVEEVLQRHKSLAPSTSRRPRFKLLVRQQPKCGLAVGNEEAGLKNARANPIDPPPICEVVPELMENVRLISLPELSLQARLVSSESGLVEVTSRNGVVQPLVGDMDQCAFIAPKIQSEQERCLFVFSELGVRQAGTYRIRLDLVERVGYTFSMLTSVYTDPFEIHATRSTFPGLAPSTELTQAIFRRGLKIRLVKEAKQCKKGTKKRKNDDGRTWRVPQDGENLFTQGPYTSPLVQQQSPNSFEAEGAKSYAHLGHGRDTGHQTGPPPLQLPPSGPAYTAPPASIFHYSAQSRPSQAPAPPIFASTRSTTSLSSSLLPPPPPLTHNIETDRFGRRGSNPSTVARRLLPQMPPEAYGPGFESNPMFQTPTLPADRAFRSFLLASRPLADVYPHSPSWKTQAPDATSQTYVSPSEQHQAIGLNVESGRWGDRCEADPGVQTSSLPDTLPCLWAYPAKRIFAPHEPHNQIYDVENSNKRMSVSSLTSGQPPSPSTMEKRDRPTLPPLASLASSAAQKVSTTSSGLLQWDRGVDRESG